MSFGFGLFGPLFIIVLVLGLLSMLAFGLRHGLHNLKMRRERAKKLVIFVVTGMLLWLAILGFLALGGFFARFEVMLPRLMITPLPLLFATLVLLFSRKFLFLLLAIPPAWLLYAQGFRLFLELFLWLGYRAGEMPPQMTFAWLNYDIIVGLTAPLAGAVFFGRGRFQRFEALLWNIFGIVLLLNVVLIAALSIPSTLRVFMNEPANTFMARFPYVWIPGFMVPFALALHLFSLQQLLYTPRQQRTFTLRRNGDSP
jgi:hypothetical protein